MNITHSYNYYYYIRFLKGNYNIPLNYIFLLPTFKREPINVLKNVRSFKTIVLFLSNIFKTKLVVCVCVYVCMYIM